MKKVLIAIGIVVVLLIAVALALPFLIDVNRFKPTLESGPFHGPGPESAGWEHSTGAAAGIGKGG